MLLGAVLWVSLSVSYYCWNLCKRGNSTGCASHQCCSVKRWPRLTWYLIYLILLLGSMGTGSARFWRGHTKEVDLACPSTTVVGR